MFNISKMIRLLFVISLVSIIPLVSVDGATQKEAAEAIDRAGQKLEKLNIQPTASFEKAKRLLCESAETFSANHRAVRFISKSVSGETVVTTIEQSWDGSSWVNETKSANYYTSEDMTGMTQSVFLNWQNNAWVNDLRTVFYVNNQDQWTQMDMDEWINNAWITKTQMIYSYDGNGNETQFLMQSEKNGSLENVSRTDYGYDSHNYLIQEDGYSWDGSSWMSLYNTTYTNDANGNPLEKVTSMDLGGGFALNTDKVTNTYDGQNNCLTSTAQIWSLIDNAWQNSSKSIYQYTSQGQIEEWISQGWDGSDWVNNMRNAINYDSGNQMMMESVWQWWENDAWLNNNRTIYTYNNDGDETESLDQVWDGGSWTNEEKTSTTYISPGMPDEMITQVWDGSAWVNSEKMIMSYGATGVESIGAQIPQSFELSNYPNPFNPSTIMVFQLPQNDQVWLRIYDARGRLVRTLIQGEKRSAGIYEVEWDGRDSRNSPVSTGVYFYQLKGERTHMTNRCTLIQ